MYPNIVSLTEKKYQKWAATPGETSMYDIDKIKVLIIHQDEEMAADLYAAIPSTNKTVVNVKEASLQIEKAYQDEDPFQIVIIDDETLKKQSESIALWFLYHPYLQNSFFLVMTNDQDSLIIRLLKSEVSVGIMNKSMIQAKINQDYLMNVYTKLNFA